MERPISRQELTPVSPLEIADWDTSLTEHPNASFYHSRAWARVLNETYGHRPFYLCRHAGGSIESLLPIMEVSSRWTGRRGVSLPFTDFCFPTMADKEGRRDCYASAMALGRQRDWRYLECRGKAANWQGASPSLSFLGHSIDLESGAEKLFKGLDGSVRRGIRKAIESRLKVDFSTSVEAMRTFYSLHCRTRRKHGVPPQPFRFFERIARHVLGCGFGFVAIARASEQPVSAAVFFHFGREAIYKFGASDYSFQHLRPNNLVMWESLKRCAEMGFHWLHLGRTSSTNEGLRRFKLGFGAREETIDYFRYDFSRETFVKSADRAEGWTNRLFRCLPDPLFRLAGSMLYPHLS